MPRRPMDDPVWQDAVWQKASTFWKSASNVATTTSGALTDSAAVMYRRLQGEAAARPSWSVGFEAAVVGLRVAIRSVARDVATIRIFTETALPRGLLPEGVTCEDADLGPGMPSGEWLWPTGRPTPHRTVMFLHGGAYCLCSSSTHRSILYWLVKFTGASVLAVNYRRPPEDPYPAPLADAAAAYQWLLQRVPADRIVFAGDSAGGGLCLALLAALRDAHRPLPAGAVLLSPWVELSDTTRDSWTRNAPYDFLDAELARYFAAMYAAGRDMDHPKLSPINADLRGLPPLHVEVGGCEVLLDQILEFARRAHAAGVDLRLVVAEDMPHVYALFTFAVPQCDNGRTPEPFRAFERIADFLDDRIPPPPPAFPEGFVDLDFAPVPLLPRGPPPNGTPSHAAPLPSLPTPLPSPLPAPLPASLGLGPAPPAAPP